MIVRKAIPQDSKSIAVLFLSVMKFMVYRFIGEQNEKKAIDFFMHFIQQKENQYSYENCFVAEVDQKIVGVINIYEGDFLKALRQPILDYIHKYYNPELHIEDETQSGESYIDVIAVKTSFQGKGIGSLLLEYAIQKFCFEQQKILGLLVDKNNPNAKKLYLKYGFENVGEQTLSGHYMEHLQLKITTI